MAHTVDAVIYDPAGPWLAMIVIPDDDAQLDDPSYNPQGMVQVRVLHDPKTADPVGAAVSAATLIVPGLALKGEPVAAVGTGTVSAEAV